MIYRFLRSLIYDSQWHLFITKKEPVSNWYRLFFIINNRLYQLQFEFIMTIMTSIRMFFKYFIFLSIKKAFQIWKAFNYIFIFNIRFLYRCFWIAMTWIEMILINCVFIMMGQISIIFLSWQGILKKSSFHEKSIRFCNGCFSLFIAQFSYCLLPNINNSLQTISVMYFFTPSLSS